MGKPFSRASIARIAVAFLSVSFTAAASAATFYWTDWVGTDLDSGAGFHAEGIITTSTSTVDVTYTNANGVSFYQSGGGTDWYVNRAGDLRPSPYTSSLVDNRPTGSDIIALEHSGTQTLQFSQAIANPVFAFVSLNRNGYAFDQDFEILSLGGVDGKACGYWGCGGASKEVVETSPGVFEYQLNSNNVGGLEPHGTIRFVGTFDTLTWRSSSEEIWNGFTVGVQGTRDEVCQPGSTLPECGGSGTQVPAPSPLALLASGLLGAGVLRRYGRSDARLRGF